MKTTPAYGAENQINPAERLKLGKTAGFLGLASNALLFALKIAVGAISRSITIIADAVNNLSDTGGSVVTLIGFRMSGRPADSEHPYGHARYEYVGALIVAFVVLAIGVLLCKTSIEKIISPEEVAVGWFAYAVLGFSIALKGAQSLMYSRMGKKIQSGILKAAAADSRNDVITTLAVLVSTIVIDVSGVNIDGYMGVVVSLFIIVSSMKLLHETISPLIGVKPDPALVDELEKAILSYEGVIGLHDLVLHDYGEGNTFAVVHVEMPAELPVMHSHDVIDNIEHDVLRRFGVRLTVHMDPVDTTDEELPLLKERASAALGELSDRLSLHDFRIVRGPTHTNVLFDVVIPYECPLTLAQVRAHLEKAFSGDGKVYYFVLNLDRNMT